MPIASLVVDTRQLSEIRDADYGVPRVNGRNVSTALPHGDVWITTADGALISIERKTTRDFLGSIRDGRLFDQAGRMRAATPWAYEVIIGAVYSDLTGLCIVDGTPTNWSYAAYMGARMTLQEMGIVVVDVESEHAFRRVLTTIADRSRTPVRLKPQRDPLAVTPDEEILAAFRGIGIERAQKLIAHCGTAAYALAYLTHPSQDDRDCKMGTSIKMRVRAALGLRHDERIATVPCSTEDTAAARALWEKYNHGQHDEPEPVSRATEATTDG